MEVVELNDFLPVSLQEHIKNILLDKDFDWHYIADVTFDEHHEQGDVQQPGFYNTPVLDGRPMNKFFDCFSFFVPLLMDAYSKFYPPAHIHLSRMRIGLNIPGSGDGYNNPHVDHEGCDISAIKNNVVALYYVNSTPGDTYIFNETEKSEKYTTLAKIKPQQGKLVFFDGNHYHASSSSKSNDVRLVISFNLYEFH
tara:strand:+ start:597 stop:1184 length:588 start_codon:yes stop_codon:yes gene_type:complete